MTALAKLRVHGDRLVRPGLLDFAVNVWPGPRPPEIEAALESALRRTGYPDDRGARRALARRHRRPMEEVLLLNGACEGFWLLSSALRPRLAACVHPGFTEPELALRAAGTEVARLYREPFDRPLGELTVPDDAEIVVVGNPNNPTGTLTAASQLRGLIRPGRLLVVDEAFMDFVPEGRESLAEHRSSELVVLRSLGKTCGLAGIRAGYLLGPAELVRRLERNRQPWSVNALACAALEAAPSVSEFTARVASEVAGARAELAVALEELPGVRAWHSAANFLLLEVRNGRWVVSELAGRGIAVRPASTFPGLGRNHVRVAVRRPQENRALVRALRQVLGG